MLTKEQKVEIIENAVKDYFNVEKVNLLNILKYLNMRGNMSGNYWRVLIDGDDLIGENHSGDTDYIVGINANETEISKQSENVVNEIYEMIPNNLKPKQD